MEIASMRVNALPCTPLRPPRVLVVGAGIGGLTAAALMARSGIEVQLLERAAAPGGKMRQIELGPQSLDGGPTVLTMRWVFDALFEHLGLSLDQHLSLRRCSVLARHAWGPDQRLDLSADLETSVAAIAEFSGAAEAQRYRAFCERAGAVYQTLDRPFMQSSRPTPGSLAWRVLRQQGPSGLRQLLRISPFTSLWTALGRYFHDPRLRQLFGRYATYCGSSPFEAPATLMLVAHVEREAVWQIEGGMYRLAQALAAAGRQQGVSYRYGCEVRQLLMRADGGVGGVELQDGERLSADAVLFNGDAQALASGLLGRPVQQALSLPAIPPPRSLSALTWHLLAEVEAGGFELSHHNVFFGPAEHYRAEFDAIAQGHLPGTPTVYVCAQDRAGDASGRPPQRAERLMCLVNAPAMAPAMAPASARALTEPEIARCQQAMWDQLGRAGLRLKPSPHAPLCTRPQDFAQRFPATGGALYGPASQGWRASFFARPDGRTRVPGLFLAGGSVHPGPGVPMAALSGQRAAEQICAALHSTRRWARATDGALLTPGGISTR
ncbi:1-hydroxycarotenoid 3,4-desaturase CrtD [Paucibacter sp. M5-1]|uniref:1-hydroxycarotenoid 3,4-desaturase CrtD n=1 Tax=Paucibacter sp. M5-1 TaxID=3015998 RepID=UPI0022B89C7C|nr:1-hydroxycarotenoid 3,4-desaturase CrtD [Paucibacter sp. M5-1]MCZ7885009.1 phytoene desaturase family protein [Paucibacter sp. M5-1]